MRRPARRELPSATRRRADVLGTPTSYTAWGPADAKEAVVLVHGLSGSTSWWSRNVAALAGRYRVYAVDLPGFGLARRNRTVRLAGAPSWLQVWMRSAGIGRAHLVAHSMGGLIALRLAAERPDLVDRLVLAAPAGVPTGRVLAQHLPALLVEALQAPANFMPVLAHDALRAGPLTLWRAGRAILADDVQPALSRVTAATLLVWGERDALVPLRSGWLLRQALPNARILVLAGAGHVVMFEQPDAFNRAVVSFLGGEVVGD